MTLPAVDALNRRYTPRPAALVQRQSAVVRVATGRVEGVALVHPIIARLGGLRGEAALVHRAMRIDAGAGS